VTQIFYKKDSAPQDILDLATIQCSVKETGECKPGFYCFQLLGPKINHIICVEKSRDQEGWMQAINDAGAQFQEVSDDLYDLYLNSD